MASLPLDSLEDPQQLLLIRLPKDIVEASRSSATGKVGSVYIYADGQAEIKDDRTNKVYELIRNVPTAGNAGGVGSQSQTVDNHEIANEESDLFKISVQKDEAVHLGKVKFSTLLAVPRVDEIDASTVFG